MKKDDYGNIQNGWLKDFFEENQEAFLVFNFDGGIIYANKQACHLFGYERDELILRSIFDFHSAETNIRVNDELKKVKDGGSVQIDSVFIDSKGKIINVELRCNIINAEKGLIGGIVKDITEQKKINSLITAQRDLALSLVSVSDLSEVFGLYVNTAMNITDMDCGGIYLLREDHENFVLEYHTGTSENFMRNIFSCSDFSSQISQVMTGNPVYADYDPAKPIFNPLYDAGNLKSLALIPIEHKGEVIGCLSLGSHMHKAVPLFYRLVLENIANQVAKIINRIRTEEYLQKIRGNFLSLFNSMEDFVFVVDMEGRIMATNPIASKSLGYTQAEFLEKNIVEISPAGQKNKAEAIFADVIAGRREHFCLSLETKDKMEIPVETIVTRGTWEGKQVLFSISRDMTEHIEFEKNLHRQEQRYRAIVEDQTELICRFLPDGTLCFVNEAYCRYFGKKHADLLGYSFMPLIPEEDQELVNQNFSSLSSLNPVINYEHRVIMPNGDINWTEWTDRAIFDDNKEIIEYQAVGRDITLRKKMEEDLLHLNESLKQRVEIKAAEIIKKNEQLLEEIRQRTKAQNELQRSEKKYRAIVEKAIEGIYQGSLDGDIVMANKSLVDMLGYGSVEDLSIVNLKGLHVNPTAREKMMQKIKDEGFIRNLELQLYRKDGSSIWINENVQAVYDEEGKISFYEAFCEDITKRKEAEDNLHYSLQNLEKAFGAIVETLSKALEVRDPYTSGHQKRVAKIACMIASNLGLPKYVIEGIKMAGIIHDIGKISVPAEILSKPTSLTKFEFALIKDHCKTGYEIIKNVDFPWPIAQMVYQHHERWNGSGYPQGLKEEDIDLGARILAVADVIEAMTNHRPYRPALGIDQALQEIRDNRNILYDQRVVDACIKIFESGRFYDHKDMLSQ